MALAPKFGRTDLTATSEAISLRDFKVTIPKRQKRSLPAIDGRPDLIPFGTAARKIGMEPKTFKRRVARGLLRGETQTLEASGGTWHFIHRDFDGGGAYRPGCRHFRLRYRSRWGDPGSTPRDPRNQRTRMPAEQQPRFPEYGRLRDLWA